MPQKTRPKTGTPAKGAASHDGAIGRQPQPSTSEELQARAAQLEAEGHIATPDLLDDATQREQA